MTQITLKGNPIHTHGSLPATGSIAPNFLLVDKDLKEKSLSDFSGRKLLYIVPSLDTPVCSMSTKKFAEQAAIHNHVHILLISYDLPFAQKRVCGAEGITNIHTLSLMRSDNFAEEYGVKIQDGPLAGLCARAVVVLDEHNRVLYTEMVSEITNEPNYSAALEAALS
ncbi:MAG: thiol peroxidase [Chlamydiae bacterium]|nr:thiol peroxidase [Chlamydiota bacterium]